MGGQPAQRGPLEAAGSHGPLWLRRRTAASSSMFVSQTSEQAEPIPDRFAWSMLGKIARDVMGRRERLPGVSTIEDVARQLRDAKRILVVTGAGVAVSCGIPDFRSKGGVYETIAERFSLPQPEMLFDLEYFKSEPEPFFQFAKVFCCWGVFNHRLSLLFGAGALPGALPAVGVALFHPAARAQGQAAAQLYAKH